MVIEVVNTPSYARNCEALNQRIWNNETKEGFVPTKQPTPLKADFQKVLFTLPFLFMSGYLLGIATILWLNGS